ncbi:hypothetical protein JI435_421030 [Parastagonospora nodorum SN15]|uniref:Uncharacterized protein n=1 Tax=Phaeosphaeria nodorum (strain SN15 / ATCC MYA-4574 / FGSC 10173) TaxID=321614 RepID=A0A7U2I773_PHANO|nr:hypothetical protein JI435_421030 [Parastagonospora nodorum SN15]
MATERKGEVCPPESVRWYELVGSEYVRINDNRIPTLTPTIVFLTGLIGTCAKLS